jgi:hypothetical protein
LVGGGSPSSFAARPISAREAAAVDWVLANGACEGSLDHLRGGIRDLRVVARCACGCASVDFVAGGQSGEARPVAEAVGFDSRGRQCGVIVWECGGRVSGLEVYEIDPDSATEVPDVASLVRWEDLSRREGASGSRDPGGVV